MRKLRVRITVRFLMLLVAIVAILASAAVTYVRTHRTHDISIAAARAVYTAIEPEVKSLMFSDDARILAAAGAQGSIQLWHTNTTWPVASRPVSRRVFRKMAISPDAR
jgi:hypothetical protein